MPLPGLPVKFDNVFLYRRSVYCRCNVLEMVFWEIVCMCVLYLINDGGAGVIVFTQRLLHRRFRPEKRRVRVSHLGIQASAESTARVSPRSVVWRRGRGEIRIRCRGFDIFRLRAHVVESRERNTFCLLRRWRGKHS